MKILVVDDNLNNRILVQAFLDDYAEENRLDFIIIEANDGLDAVRKCETDMFDIIYMDIMMPNMNGIEATRIIKEKNLNTIIVAVSAVGNEQKQKDILNCGAAYFISKPIDLDIFTSTLNNILK